MDFKQIFQKNLEKLRALPDSKKKILIWVITGIVGVIMMVFWVKSLVNGIDEFSKKTSNMKLPDTVSSEIEKISNSNFLNNK